MATIPHCLGISVNRCRWLHMHMQATFLIVREGRSRASVLVAVTDGLLDDRSHAEAAVSVHLWVC